MLLCHMLSEVEQKDRHLAAEGDVWSVQAMTPEQFYGHMHSNRRVDCSGSDDHQGGGARISRIRSHWSRH